MRLVDRIAQARTPFIVKCASTGVESRLSGVSDYASDAASCPIRYVLSDDLTRLCAALAYSKSARTLSCMDLIHIPSERVWVEWSHAPWRDELNRYGFPQAQDGFLACGRRGAYLRSSRDGRRGSVRTFWSTGETELDLAASAMEAHFDLDTAEEPDPNEAAAPGRRAFYVVDNEIADAATLSRCFRFEFERTWGDYYDNAGLSAALRAKIDWHSLGTIALDIPLLLTFFLLLGARAGLPQRAAQLERLNRSRSREGKAPLLDHVEVRAPLLPEFGCANGDSLPSGRRGPRLHRVRGHLVRRRDQLFWRMPHLRGSARAGIMQRRTVTWTFDLPPDSGAQPRYVEQ
jgi:hypothetical protein